MMGGCTIRPVAIHGTKDLTCSRQSTRQIVNRDILESEIEIAKSQS
jgi:hypothetical protein